MLLKMQPERKSGCIDEYILPLSQSTYVSTSFHLSNPLKTLAFRNIFPVPIIGDFLTEVNFPGSKNQNPNEHRGV